MAPSIAVIIATYNWPKALELVLWGYAAQRDRDFRVIVADDGSGPETAETIQRLREATDLQIEHLWHEDSGWRKSEILNRAIVAAGMTVRLPKEISAHFTAADVRAQRAMDAAWLQSHGVRLGRHALRFSRDYARNVEHRAAVRAERISRTPRGIAELTGAFPLEPALVGA